MDTVRGQEVWKFLILVKRKTLEQSNLYAVGVDCRNEDYNTSMRLYSTNENDKDEVTQIYIVGMQYITSGI